MAYEKKNQVEDPAGVALLLMERGRAWVYSEEQDGDGRVYEVMLLQAYDALPELPSMLPLLFLASVALTMLCLRRRSTPTRTVVIDATPVPVAPIEHADCNKQDRV